MANFTERTQSPAGENNLCYMKNYNNFTDGWNNAILGGGDSGDPIQVPVPSANVLPNCVGYAVGRSLEIYNQITGNNPTITHNNPFNTFAGYNGEDWFNHALSLSDFNTGNVPKAGAIACYSSAGVGHVCIIEWISADGTQCRTTESGWGHYVWRTNIIRRINNWKSDTMGSDYSFQGFIYNPVASDEPFVPPTPIPIQKNIVFIGGNRRRGRRGFVTR